MWTRSNINIACSHSVPANQQDVASILSVSLTLGENYGGNYCNFLQKFIVVTATGNMHHPSVGGHHLFFFLIAYLTLFI